MQVHDAGFGCCDVTIGQHKVWVDNDETLREYQIIVEGYANWGMRYAQDFLDALAVAQDMVEEIERCRGNEASMVMPVWPRR